MDKEPVGSDMLPSTVKTGVDALSSACSHPQRPSSADGALPPDDQGYTPMDIIHSEGIYMTHIRHGHNQEAEGGIICDRRETEMETCPAAIDSKPDETNEDDDDDDDDSVYDTYTVGQDDVIRHEYMEPIGQAPRLIETAL